MVKDPETREPAGEETRLLTKKCLENGLILQQASYANMANVWRIAPPMTATYEELDRGVELLDKSMTEMGHRARMYGYNASDGQRGSR